MKAALAYLCRPMVPRKFMDSLVDLGAYEATLPPADRVFDQRILRLQFPPYPAQGRRQLVREFLRLLPPDVDRLLMVDDDQRFDPWQPATLVGLLGPATPVVSGLYFAYDEDKRAVRPIILRGDHATGCKTVWRYAAGMVEVDTVGMGFCGIWRPALEEWRAAHGDTWFDHRARANGDAMIEDAAFCARMQSLGKKLYVQTNLRIGHVKLVEVGESDYRPRDLPAANL